MHWRAYAAVERRLLTERPGVPFTLPPRAVLRKVPHALESPRPRVRYYVTFPSYVFAVLRRTMSHRMLDRVPPGWREMRAAPPSSSAGTLSVWLCCSGGMPAMALR